MNPASRSIRQGGIQVWPAACNWRRKRVGSGAMSGLRFVFTHGFEQALITPGREGFQKAPGAGICGADAPTGASFVFRPAPQRPSGHAVLAFQKYFAPRFIA